jgi:hypothetical protein
MSCTPAMIFLCFFSAALRIRDFYPDPNFSIPDLGSKVETIPDPHQRTDVMFIPDPELFFYPSRIQGSKKDRIPDPDPQHCFLVWHLF